MSEDEDEPFIRAWEERQMREMTEQFRPLFRQHGHGFAPESSRAAMKAERQRVSTILSRDHADRAAEEFRRGAELEVGRGKTVYVADTVIPPTPEQFEQAKRTGGRFNRYTPRQPDGTVRVVTTYRREALSPVKKLILSGLIDVDQFKDCLWYRNLYESTGLTGRVGSVDFGREVFSSPQSRAMFADRQVEAQDTFRFVRANIEARARALLDKIVLEDVPIWRAAKSVGIGYRRTRPAFVQAVQQLSAARSDSGRS